MEWFEHVRTHYRLTPLHCRCGDTTVLFEVVFVKSLVTFHAIYSKTNM